MKTSVLAVDIGYGNTRYCYRSSRGALETGIFPSLAPLAPIDRFSEYDLIVPGSPKLATIEIDRVEYWVGPDIPITAAYDDTGRALVDDYPETPNFAALLFGAIHFAGAEHIDCLVIGLPRHNVKQYAEQVKTRFTGEFDFGHGPVRIDDVIVIPQATGSLMMADALHSNSSNFHGPRLLLDVGYFTTNWIYATDVPREKMRMGSLRFGTSDVFDHMAANISRDEGEQYGGIERIDKTLREASPFLFYGKELDLMAYEALAAPILTRASTELHASIGRLPSECKMILTGGGADRYGLALGHAYQHLEVISLDSPCLANVRGALLIGEAALRQERCTR